MCHQTFETTAVMPQKNSRVQKVAGISEHQVKVASQFNECAAYEADRKFTRFREYSSKPMKFIISNKFPLFRNSSLTVKAHYTDSFKYCLFLSSY